MSVEDLEPVEPSRRAELTTCSVGSKLGGPDGNDGPRMSTKTKVVFDGALAPPPPMPLVDHLTGSVGIRSRRQPAISGTSTSLCR
jgi:hypothetical protein